ncbi:MAG: hypothetical protein Q9200_003933 [Gallowayella weberi]
MSNLTGTLCFKCSEIDLAQYFREELHVLRQSSGFVGPAPGAVRLCSLMELYTTSSTCAFCGLVIAALCNFWEPQNWTSPNDFIEWAHALDDVSGIYLYSYLYAEDPPRDALTPIPKDANDSGTRRSFRLGIALRERAERNRPYLDHAADIQLLSTSSCHIGLGSSFYGRVINPARANLHLASEWLDECENGRQGLCETTARDGNVAYTRIAPYNLRVIDVNSMSLVLLPQRSKYIALSYCWGQSNRHFITTNSNVAELHAKGSLQRTFPLLPRTIQDAINCVREIGRNFLWVDALCIIQDNDSDREMQILQMDRVYDNALLTIISAPPHFANSTRYDGLPGYRAGSRASCQDIARIQGMELCTTLRNVELAMQFSPWSTRAWTFQEHLLSRRRMYFTGTQLYFQCPCGVFCEDVIGETKSPSAFVYPGSSLWNISGLYSNLTQGQASNAEGLSRTRFVDTSTAFAYYSNIVERYTMRDMSDQGDALNALEGVLSVLKSTMNTDFIHGLPEMFLDEALLWLLRKPHQRRTALSDRNSGIGFPSWSWVGWNTQSNYRAQFSGYIRREVEWYLVNKDGIGFKLLPRDDWEPSEPFDPSGHQNIQPRGRPPEDFLKILRNRERMKTQDLSSCSLVCWTGIATFQLLGDSLDLGEGDADWKDYKAFIISDLESQPVGTIFLEKTWSDVIEKQKNFEFMILSRSNTVDDMVAMDETMFPTSAWCFVNVMLIQRNANTAQRLGVGVVHEFSWISVAPKPMLIHLE